MQRHETLLELVEQAACGINMLDPANLNDLNELLSTLSQIKEQVSSAMEGPSELLDRVKGSGTAAVDLLSEMIDGRAADLDLVVGEIEVLVVPDEHADQGQDAERRQDESDVAGGPIPQPATLLADVVFGQCPWSAGDRRFGQLRGVTHATDSLLS